MDLVQATETLKAYSARASTRVCGPHYQETSKGVAAAS